MTLFQFSVHSTVEHVILHVTSELDIADPKSHMLKVRGLAEYLLPNTILSSYVYVHQCIKLDEDVELSLIPQSQVPRMLARTVSNQVIEIIISFRFKLLTH